MSDIVDLKGPMDDFIVNYRNKEHTYSSNN